MSFLEPLLEATAPATMGAIAIAMMAVYALGRGRSSVWPATLLRVLAVAGIVVPGMTIIGWYEQLRRTSELTEALPVRTAPVIDMVIVNSAVLLSAGFLLLIGGVYLARQLFDRPDPGPGEPAGAAE
jgi:ABC-type glycerol-3-phosphate transport system permease component